MDELTDILQRATAEIASQYFLLPVHGADPVYRERVYCYELYHRMRSLWPKRCLYVLNGEVDKQQHPYFGVRYPKPDFLVHIPGTGNNYGAIEVKSRLPSPNQIRKDVDTLLRFRDVGYQRAIYLFYGVDPKAIHKRVVRNAGNREHLAAIELWTHAMVGAPAIRVAWELQGV